MTAQWVKYDGSDVRIIVKTWTGHFIRLTRYALEPSIVMYGAENYNWTP